MNELLASEILNVILVLGILIYLVFKNDEHRNYKILEKRTEDSTLDNIYIFVISNDKTVKQIIVSKDVYWNYNIGDKVTSL